MPSMIRTNAGITLMIDKKSYTIESTHLNYALILDAIRTKQWDAIPHLYNVVNMLTKSVEKITTPAKGLKIENGRLFFRNDEVQGIIAERILAMHSDGFDLTPMDLFLSNLYENPSNKAVMQMYGWMEANGITITEDGHLLAYKRVRDDYKSFHDANFDNSVGTTPEMPRNKCDDRSEVTCSTGLHFCSQAYLPHYSGGRGRVLILKINPRDVVSIPTDYNNAKGRACKYLVLTELKDEARVDVEETHVMSQPIVLDKRTEEAVSVGVVFQMGYTDGYKDGRQKKASGHSYNPNFANTKDAKQYDQYKEGYEVGRKDGRNKVPKAYNVVSVG